MKSHAARSLTLSLVLMSALVGVAAPAHAGRDEALIKQTRKNQLAHDAAHKTSTPTPAPAAGPTDR